MGLMTPLVVYAAAVVVGIPISVVAGRGYWKSDETLKSLKSLGYERVRDRVRGYQLAWLLAWPALLPYALVVCAWDAAVASSDPHVKHRADLDRQVEQWKSLVQLQRNLGQEVDTEKPQVWCACQKVPEERNRHEVEIQRLVEILLRREEARLYGGKKGMVTPLDNIKAELCSLGMWE